MTIIICNNCDEKFDDKKPYYWIDIMNPSLQFTEEYITDWQFCSRNCLIEFSSFPQLERN